ncbi:MAG: hypothetical protein IKE29_18280 [Paenibacillus sp.]|uniref:hypothetical protein n=1 Tax=Paenibacillus sp. TaxID=58172 RepID=UPI0025F4FF3B|nr:hypothetical protein [Paenibacillus sp.]MBR2566545.1 hypothetical protein [Paenibacillus sp.]
MEFLEIGLIVVTVMLFVMGAVSKRRTFVRWGIASLLLLIVVFIPSFVNGFQDGFVEGWSAR